jgi:hypothetical protein
LWEKKEKKRKSSEKCNARNVRNGSHPSPPIAGIPAFQVSVIRIGGGNSLVLVNGLELGLIRNVMNWILETIYEAQSRSFSHLGGGATFPGYISFARPLGNTTRAGGKTNAACCPSMQGVEASLGLTAAPNMYSTVQPLQHAVPFRRSRDQGKY